jgi:hypothetical protein
MIGNDHASCAWRCRFRGSIAHAALLAAIITCALATAVWAEHPPASGSGVFGVVPYQAEDLERVAGDITKLRKELDDPKQNRASVMEALARSENTLASMKGQCARAFDPKSRMPMPYGWPGLYGPGACFDARFPTGYMRLIAAAACDQRGEFRLELPPGRYAVFTGISPISHAFEPDGRIAKTNHWFQLIVVKPHRWVETVPPPGGAVRPLQPPRIEPSYDSGVRGRAGMPSQSRSGGALPPTNAMNEGQCVEALRDGSRLVVACADCRFSDGAFELPLPPGRYTLDFLLFGALDFPQNHLRETVEIAPGGWLERYVLGAHPGAVPNPHRLPDP